MTARWAALPVLLVAVFVTTLDFYVANLAVPSIRAGLRASDADVQFVIAGYGLAYAAGLIVSGRLGDLFGHRRVFAAGLALFTLASAACGLADSPGMLVTARVAQGVAAALLAPQVLTLLGLLYQGADRARAFGWYGTAVGLAGVSGQVLGGLLVAADPLGLGWRACFLVNVPVGVAALAVLGRLLPRGGGTSGRDLDLAGAGLVAAGLVAVVLPLVEGREQGWPWWTWCCLAAAAPILGAFVRRQRRLAATGRVPLLDLDVFRDRAFTWGLVAVGLLFGTSAGLSFVLALYLQEGLGLGPLAAGVVCTALNAGFLVASLRPHRSGALVLVLGLALLCHVVAGAATPSRVALALLVTGAGMGLVMSPLLSSVLSGVRPERTGAAAGVLGTVQEAGGVLGGSITGAMFFGTLDGFGTMDGGWRAATLAGLSVLVVAALGVLAHAARGTPVPARFHVKQDCRPDRPDGVEC
ncbi:drug resistance transporter, EmrB/QacA subfamily [Nonomuraea solani]|uniref:Drug resistance transporter, EmrB/QacA subfamily n=1 Tax=Nonomuraea solani TaxID=1144553 RepID=A0A1H6CZ77_9ACTN|nr:MFS transporter [Nonomuraea solani]SEG78064.1 drug resistance transporter, EmrB/QacA subfamily [Nonomuraea solani]